MKVVWIVPGFSSDEDDWCIPALLDLARVLAQRCRLTIVAMRYPYRRDTYPIGEATVVSIGGGHRGPHHTPFLWLNTARAIRKTDCEVIHAFWAYEPGVVAGWFRSRLPAVISLAGGELVFLPRIDYGLDRRLRTRVLTRVALKRARAVTTGSTYVSELARKIALPSLNQIPLGLNLERWSCVRHDMNPPTILSVGSLEPVTGHEVLLRAFARVRREFTTARLRIVGGGCESARLRRLAQDLALSESVEFAGAVPHHELPAVYAQASVFVQASWHEAQGMALLEAAACGLPLVGTPVGALGDFAPGAALSSAVGDEEGLAQNLLRVLKDNNLAKSLAGSARAKVNESYSVNTAAERFLKLYDSVLPIT